MNPTPWERRYSCLNSRRIRGTDPYDNSWVHPYGSLVARTQIAPAGGSPSREPPSPCCTTNVSPEGYSSIGNSFTARLSGLFDDYGDIAVCCECTPVHEADYSGESSRTPAEAVLDALGEVTDVDPIDLSPLYDAVDPDALDQLFHAADGRSDGDGLLGFAFEDWNVFVSGDGRIRVCDATRETESGPVFEKFEV
jgi:hypothetical protein